MVVELRYEQDAHYRTFEPAAVYVSAKHKVCVTGNQTQNPNEPGSSPTVHVFEIGKITDLQATTERFEPFPIDRTDRRYRNGIICAI